MVVSFAILARLIGQREMGMLAVLGLLIGLCQVIPSIGLPQAATKFIAESLPRGDKGVMSSVLWQAARTTFLLAVPLAGAVFLGANVLSVRLLSDTKSAVLFQVLAIDIIFSCGLLPVFGGAVLGLQKFKETAVIGIVNTILTQLSIILLIIFLRSFLGLVVAWAIADIATAAIYVAYLSRALGRPRFNFPLAKLLGYSWPLSIGNAVNFAYGWFDRAVLVAFVPLTTLGVYNAATTAYGVLSGGSNAMTSTLFPAYSTIQGSRGRERAGGSFRMTSRYVSFVVVPLALGLLATAKPALALFVGQAYTEGAGPLMILAGVFAFTLVGTVVGPMLLALGETRAASVITVASVSFSLVVALVLLPTWGMLGASMARGLAMIFSTALAVLVTRKKVRLELDNEAIVKSLVAGVTMAAVVMAMQFLMYSRFLLPLYVVGGCIVYLTALRVLKAARTEDIDLIRKYLGNRMNFMVTAVSRILLPAS
jgi:stage V sporulation protein B